ncbi:MAG: YdcH family protein [Geminicoccales bacterium]
MSHVPHELADELPDYKDRIHELKINDQHFARLFDDYHHVNREIHRAESAGINIADQHHEELKRKRLHLKDEMFSILQMQA